MPQEIEKTRSSPGKGAASGHTVLGGGGGGDAGADFAGDTGADAESWDVIAASSAGAGVDGRVAARASLAVAGLATATATVKMDTGSNKNTNGETFDSTNLTAPRGEGI